MHVRISVGSLGLAGLLLAAGVALAAADAPRDAGAARVVVLDTTGFWRIHHTLKPPVIALDGGPQPMDLRWHHPSGGRVLRTFRWVSSETPPPSAGWASADFDDSTWLRGPGRMAALTPFLSRLCMRGKFRVTDPAKVDGLRLTVAYSGGIIVRINGREIARAHLPAGADGEKVLAEGYPAEAFAPNYGWGGKPPRTPKPESEAMRRLRTRTLEGIAIPSEQLRKGLNVLALEIIRSPCHAVVEDKKDPKSRQCAYRLFFNTCEFRRVQLTAAKGDGLVPNATRLPGLHVWNTNLLAGDFDLDFGGQAEPLRPVRIVGVRNGAFSGKVAAGSTEPIVGLKASAGELRGGDGGVIPASAVRIRYGLPWGAERAAYLGLASDGYYGVTLDHMRYPRPPTLLGALSPVAVKEFPVQQKAPGRADLKTPAQPEPVFGAVVPIWMAVSIPRDAGPGEYRGRLVVTAAGHDPVTVPVELKVLDWALPDKKDWRSWVELIQSPDTLAMEYGVKLWSQRHWELISRSMSLLGEVGCDIVYLPLIAETNLGNAQSMLRWVKQPKGGYDFDFSVMDRYLDLAVEHMGKPTVVCFVVWDIYLGAGGGYKDNYGHNQPGLKARMKYAGKGPMVTLLDPKSGKTQIAHLPPYSDPASKGLWKTLFGQLRQRMRRRGLEDAMMIGLMSDDWPSKQENVFYDEVTGGLPWVSHSHVGITGSDVKGEEAERHGELVEAGVSRQGDQTLDRRGLKVGYHSAVFYCHVADNDPPCGSLGGWNRADLAAYQPRYESAQPASRWRHLVELNVTGAQRGVARGGADFWSVVKDSRGRRRGTVTALYPHSMWRNLNIPWCLLAPGPDGPVATDRFEAFREGVQDSEARIFIERALADEQRRVKLGDDLAGRCTRFLTERTFLMLKACTGLQLGSPHFVMARPIVRQNAIAGHAWFVGSGWQRRSAELYSLAGEVARKLGAR